jgi:hypothetical protein
VVEVEIVDLVDLVEEESLMVEVVMELEILVELLIAILLQMVGVMMVEQGEMDHLGLAAVVVALEALAPLDLLVLEDLVAMD